MSWQRLDRMNERLNTTTSNGYNAYKLSKCGMVYTCGYAHALADAFTHFYSIFLDYDRRFILTRSICLMIIRRIRHVWSFQVCAFDINAAENTWCYTWFG